MKRLVEYERERSLLMKNENPEDREIAEHESIHAILAWAVGLKIVRVSLIGPVREDDAEEMRTPFHCVFEGAPIAALNRLSTEGILARLFVNLGPYVIEQSKKTKPSFGTLKDVHQAMQILTWSEQKPLKKFVEGARKALKEHKEDWQTAAKEFAETHSGRVKKILRSENAQRCLKVLAAELLKHGCLSGFEVASILENNWKGPLPPKVKPRREHSTGLSPTSPENSIQAAIHLTKMALELLCEDIEDRYCEKGRETVLQSLFQLEEVAARIRSSRKNDGV